jgi:hypothetical protein
MWGLLALGWKVALYVIAVNESYDSKSAPGLLYTNPSVPLKEKKLRGYVPEMLGTEKFLSEVGELWKSASNASMKSLLYYIPKTQ